MALASGGYEAFRWEANVMTGLGELSGGAYMSCAEACNDDANIVVGGSSGTGGMYAFLKDGNSAMVNLGNLAQDGNYSKALGVRDDGSIVVGYKTVASGPTGKRAFIWDATNHMRDLAAALVSDANLNLTGWTLYEATGITPDGAVIVGNGLHNGHKEGWVAVLVDLTMTVDANSDQIVNWDANTSAITSANLSGTVSDDGNPSATCTWTKESGPDNGSVVFANANASETTATFSKPGTYVMRLTATTPGRSPVFDECTVKVNWIWIETNSYVTITWCGAGYYCWSYTHNPITICDDSTNSGKIYVHLETKQGDLIQLLGNTQNVHVYTQTYTVIEFDGNSIADVNEQVLE